MTFKHKLSKRLAIIWDAAVVLGTLAMFACAGEQPTGSPVATSAEQLPPPVLNIGVTSDTPTVLFEEAFEDNAFASRGWYDNTSLVTTTAEHAPGSTRALELRYVAGATTPVNGGSARRQFPASPTVYVSYWVKYSPNWVGSGRAYHPHEFLIVSDQDGAWDGPAQSWLVAYVEHNYQNGGIPRLQLQDNKAINATLGALPINLVNLTENRSTSGCNGVVEANLVTTCFNMPPWYNGKELHAPRVTFQPAAGPGYKADWNHVEAYFQLNSIANGKGIADGVMQYWFNGELIIDRHDMLFRTAARPTIQFDKFMIAPYIGDGSPVSQTMWVDDLTVATGRIASDSAPPPPPSGSVGKVADLAVASVTDSSVTLSFAEVDDGTGKPANYFIRWVAGALAWGAATDVTRGTCKVPLAGSTIGTIRTCTVLGLADSTGYQFQLVAFRGTLNVDAVFGALSNVASGRTAARPVVPAPVASVTLTPANASLTVAGTQQLAATVQDSSGNTLSGRTVTWASSAPAIAIVSGSGLVTAVLPGSATITATSEGVQGTAAVSVTAPVVTQPGTVTDLTVAGVTDTSVTLTFTEVTNGAGQPASYNIRWSVGVKPWGAATDVTKGGCKVPLAGITVGAKRTCKVQGLVASTSYQFQVVAFRGTLNVDAVFGGLSNVASGTTAAPAPPPAPVASVTVTPANASLIVGGSQQLAAALKDSSGNTLSGRSVTWTSNASAVATVSSTGLVKAVGAGNAAITATSEGVQGSASVAITASVTKPGTVTDLAVAGVTESSVTLSFTEVGDGAGQPAGYFVRFSVAPFAWGSGSDVASGTCKVPLSGSVTGARRTCTVLGLAIGTSYQFQLVAFRGTLNVDAVFGGLSNVASGTTATSTAPVASISLTPVTTSLAVGSTQLFTATLKDANGNTLSGRAVTWTSSNPSVATVGSPLVTAVAAGTATITAASEGTSGTAGVTVTEEPPPPPPGSWPNEPAGFTLLSDYGFGTLVPATNQGDLLGQGWRIWWNTAGHGTLAQDNTAPQSPSGVFQVHYPIGWLSGYEPAMVEYNFGARPTEIYWGFWWKPSNPFQSDASGVNKIAFVWTPSGATDLIYFDLSPGPWRIRAMDNLMAGGGPRAGLRDEPNVTTTVITLGQWHRIEIYVKYSTGSLANGVLKWWVNGVLNGHYTNLKMVQDGGFDHLQFAPTYGGNTGDRKTQNDYFWYDHVRLSRGP